MSQSTQFNDGQLTKVIEACTATLADQTRKAMLEEIAKLREEMITAIQNINASLSEMHNSRQIENKRLVEDVDSVIYKQLNLIHTDIGALTTAINRLQDGAKPKPAAKAKGAAATMPKDSDKKKEVDLAMSTIFSGVTSPTVTSMPAIDSVIVAPGPVMVAPAPTPAPTPAKKAPAAKAGKVKPVTITTFFKNEGSEKCEEILREYFNEEQRAMYHAWKQEPKNAAKNYWSLVAGVGAVKKLMEAQKTEGHAKLCAYLQSVADAANAAAALEDNSSVILVAEENSGEQ